MERYWPTGTTIEFVCLIIRLGMRKQFVTTGGFHFEIQIISLSTAHDYIMLS